MPERMVPLVPMVHLVLKVLVVSVVLLVFPDSVENEGSPAFLDPLVSPVNKEVLEPVVTVDLQGPSDLLD